MVNKPLKMKYCNTGETVDVYNITIVNEEQCLALCWFEEDKCFRITDIDFLSPISKSTLNE